MTLIFFLKKNCLVGKKQYFVFLSFFEKKKEKQRKKNFKREKTDEKTELFPVFTMLKKNQQIPKNSPTNGIYDSIHS